MLSINIKKDLKGYDGNFTLKVDVSLGKGIHAIVSDSGSGKTTLLNIISGLDSDLDGTIILDDKILYNNKICIKPQKRNVAYLMQNYRLFEHKTLYENLLFANSDKLFANNILKSLNIYNLKDSYPKNLSGGQIQRGALAMMMMLKPKLFLIDEPTSALDNKSSNSIIELIHKMSEEYDMTIIVVTHKVKEALKLSSSIYTIDSGELKKYYPTGSGLASVLNTNNEELTIKIQKELQLNSNDKVYIEKI